MQTQFTYTVFTDFDGTIAVNDIGDAMFERYGNVERCSKSFGLYREGKIDARDCWRQGFATVGPLTKEEFTAFALAQPADRYFGGFVEYCRLNAIPVTVLSENP